MPSYNTVVVTAISKLYQLTQQRRCRNNLLVMMRHIFPVIRSTPHSALHPFPNTVTSNTFRSWLLQHLFIPRNVLHGTVFSQGQIFLLLELLKNLPAGIIWRFSRFLEGSSSSFQFLNSENKMYLQPQLKVVSFTFSVLPSATLSKQLQFQKVKFCRNTTSVYNTRQQSESANWVIQRIISSFPKKQHVAVMTLTAHLKKK